MALKNQMEELVKSVEKFFDDGGVDHYTACCQAADAFALWQSDAEYMAEPLSAPGDRFPLWLSFVVQGVMRDKGIED